VVIALAALVLPAAAWAHGGSSAKGYVSTVDHIDAADAVDGQVNANGNFTFTAPAGHVVIVDGYSNEPYLRFAGGRVYENANAPTTFVNGDKPVPSSLPSAPEWHQIASGQSYAWHDHRTHWMNAQPPDAVQKAPHLEHHILDWTIGGTVDRRRFQIVGTLDWGPTKSGPGYQWISFIVIAAGVLYAAFLLFTRRAAKPSPA
jgi:hypothetical protein